MSAMIRIAVSIKKALFEQVEGLAKQLGISRDQLIEQAMNDFIARAGDGESNLPDKVLLEQIAGTELLRPTGTGLEINQGDVFWVPLEAWDGGDPGFTHPHVVIQDNVLNHSRINSVVVCALTSNIKRAGLPGNVLLDAGEANLSRQSVVVVSQVSTVDKTQLGEYIGSLSPERVNQILAGMRFLQLLSARHDLPGKI